jgi:para-nitrobenzyl esterase
MRHIDQKPRLALRPVSAALAMVLLLGFQWPAAAAPTRPIVKIRSGTIVGQYLGNDGDVGAFFGIPYAVPPIGQLRFSPPQPLRSLPAHPFLATDNAIACIQATPNVAYQPTPVLSEDCLILNVWTAREHEGEQRPVMVWFHGGGNTSGNSNPYHGIQAVEEGHIVLVTVNYRLGALGFLALPALDAENENHVSGNQGIEDQQLALKWVRDNIAAFGGDPDNVTIFGVSAGANDIAAHLVSPTSHGRFQKAIIESLVGPGVNNVSLTQAEANDLAAIHRADTASSPLGCLAAEINADQLLACLRSLPAKALVSLASPGEIVDGVIVPQFPPIAFADGDFNHVPIIEGSNQTEGTFFQNVTLTEAGYNAFLGQLFTGTPNAAALVNYVEFTLYPSANYPAPGFPSGSPSLAAAIVSGDSGVVCNAENTRALLARWVPVRGYEFNQPDPVEQVRITPATGIVTNDAHTTEIAYDFYIDSEGNPLTGQGTDSLPPGSPAQWGNGTLEDAALSEVMIGYWTNFAATDNPNHRGPGQEQPLPERPHWPSYTPDAPIVQSLINTSVNGIPRAVGAERDFSVKHNCDFWANPAVGGGKPGNHLIAPSGPN